MPQIRDYPQATSLQPTDAFVIDRVGSGTEYVEASAFSGLLTPGTYGDSTHVAQVTVNADGNISNLANVAISRVWAIAGIYEGTTAPTSSQLLAGWNAPFAASFPADNTAALAAGFGFHVQAGHLPTSVFVIDIAKNDVVVGSITVQTDGTWSYSTSGGAWSVAVRDRVTLIAPSVTDATMNYFYFTLVGTIA